MELGQTLGYEGEDLRKYVARCVEAERAQKEADRALEREKATIAAENKAQKAKIEADRETEKVKIEAAKEAKKQKLKPRRQKLKLRRRLKWLKFRHSEKVKRKQDEMR